MRGYLYGRGGLLDVLLQVRARAPSPRLAAVAQHDDGAHDRAALGVGGGDGRGLGDRGMLDQRRLDLEGADPVAGREDHVVEAALEPQVAVLVAAHAVAGAPARVARTARLAEVAAEERRHGRRVERQLARRRPARPSLVDDVERRSPGSGLPIEPGRTGSPAGMPVSWPVSVWP